MQTATLGGGCFWCIDAIYRQVQGVQKVTVGYAGGSNPNPTYESSHTDGHAEVIQVEFDESVITYETILEIFWNVHDPTTLNRQGNDVGPAYRSIILANDEQQYQTARTSREEVGQPVWDDPIVTEIDLLKKFHPAEEYHQDYFNKNPSQAYCQIIINPKLAKFQKKFSQLSK